MRSHVIIQLPLAQRRTFTKHRSTAPPHQDRQALAQRLRQQDRSDQLRRVLFWGIKRVSAGDLSLR
jgi:hypothetical protein